MNKNDIKKSISMPDNNYITAHCIFVIYKMHKMATCEPLIYF